jgi:hypothetical protein
VPYVLGGPRALHLLPIISTLICLAAAARLAQRALPAPQDPRGWWAAIAGVGAVVATPMVFHGATILEHAPAAALATAALLPLSKRLGAAAGNAPAAVPPPGAALMTGFLLGVAAWLRPEALLMFPALAAGWAMAIGPAAGARLLPGFAAGGALVLLPRALHLRAATGSWLPAGSAWPGQPQGPAWEQAAALLLPGSARTLCALVLAGACLAAVPAVRRLLAATAGSRWPAVAGAAATALLLAAGPGTTASVALSGRPLASTSAGLGSLPHMVPVVALAPLILLIPGLALSATARLLAWTAVAYTVLIALLSPMPALPSWGLSLLLPAAPLMVIAVVAAVAGLRGRPGGRLAVAGLCVALAAGVAVQVLGLRFLVAVASTHGAALRRVERAVPEGDAILTDVPAVAQMIAPLSRTRPVLYVAPGSDLDPLMARLDEAGSAPFWITRQDGEAPAFAGLSGGRETKLGGGLRLLRFQQEAGVRGFARLPKGD